jgi:DNA-binding transcriptional MerR regulator
MAAPGREHFDIRQVSTLTDFKPAMVDYLCRSGVLVPSGRSQPGRGKRRLYTFGDIVMLRAIRHLLGCGISVAKLRGALHAARQHHKEITESSLPWKYMVTDGTKVYFHDREGVVEQLTGEGQLVFHFVIKLEPVHRYVADGARTLRRRFA